MRFTLGGGMSDPLGRIRRLSCRRSLPPANKDFHMTDPVPGMRDERYERVEYGVLVTSYDIRASGEQLELNAAPLIPCHWLGGHDMTTSSNVYAGRSRLSRIATLCRRCGYIECLHETFWKPPRDERMLEAVVGRYSVERITVARCANCYKLVVFGESRCGYSPPGGHRILEEVLGRKVDGSTWGSGTPHMIRQVGAVLEDQGEAAARDLAQALCSGRIAGREFR
jgi:hypothetical protein